MIIYTTSSFEQVKSSLRVSNIYSHVCLCVCVSVCVFVQVITFKLPRLGTSISVYTYIIKISKSGLSTKVMESGLRSNKSKLIFHIIKLQACIPMKLDQRPRSFKGQGHLI